MNANQIINMVLRQIVNRLVRGGINKGLDLANRKTSGRRDSADAGEKSDRTGNS